MTLIIRQNNVNLSKKAEIEIIFCPYIHGVMESESFFEIKNKGSGPKMHKCFVGQDPIKKYDNCGVIINSN